MNISLAMLIATLFSAVLHSGIQLADNPNPVVTQAPAVPQAAASTPNPIVTEAPVVNQMQPSAPPASSSSSTTTTANPSGADSPALTPPTL